MLCWGSKGEGEYEQGCLGWVSAQVEVPSFSGMFYLVLLGVRKVLLGVRKVLLCVRKVLLGVRKVLLGVRKELGKCY